MRKLLAIALTGGLLVGMLVPAQAKPAQVFEDIAGDAGNQDSGVPGFDQLGFDLIGGTIERKGANLDFTVLHAAMPPVNQPPEKVRFMWGFAVDGTSYRVTVKSADVGKPNPVAQSDTDRIGKVDPQGFFRLEGDCGSQVVGALQAVHCPTIGYLTGAFDAAAKTISFSVPLKLIKAKPGSVISGGGGDAVSICAICWTTHVGERSLNTTNIDSAAQSGTYKIPK
ncbi:MAG TPA: hypothetical protein VNP73_05505 [Actinomycetota bacterium]|nr:hypothetical protein [Actinomycetota bacterium]